MGVPNGSKRCVVTPPSLSLIVSVEPRWSVSGLLPRRPARHGRSCSAASGLRATVALKAGRGAKARRARPRAERLRRAPLFARRRQALTAVSSCASTTQRGVYTEEIRSSGLRGTLELVVASSHASEGRSTSKDAPNLTNRSVTAHPEP
jgi:hypothetical protein